MKGFVRVYMVWLLGLFVLSGCANAEESTSQDGMEDVALREIAPEEGVVLPESPVPASPGEGAGGDNAPSANIPETLEPEQEIVTITISAAGDVTLGNYEGQDYSWSFREMYESVEDEGYFFENVKDIFSGDDMTIVNLEVVLTRSEEIAPDRTYNTRGDPEYAALLTYGSIEAVSMGNNHRQDFGAIGTKDTVAALESEGIVYAYDSNVGIYETKGIRIGFVSVNETSWGRGVEKLMKDGIAKLREGNADLILACCHWGTEREYYPEEYQREFGRMCIDMGADLVLGHHPHVLQGVEEYQGKYIVYSLANFCFGANRNPADKDTMIVQQTFTFVDGIKQNETEFRVIPCSVSSVSNRNDYRPTPASGEAARRILNRINEYSQGFGVEFDENGYPIQG